MSGPTTAVIVVDPISVMISASAIRAVQNVAEGYRDAANLNKSQLAARKQRQQELQQAAAKGREALLHEAETAEAEFEAIARAAERYAAQDKVAAMRLARPAGGSETQLATYVQAMQSQIGELRAVLLTESARRMDDLGGELLRDIDIATVTGMTEETPVRYLLARIAHLDEPPQEIASVAREIGAEPHLNSERAKLLLAELRLRIQKYTEQVQQQAVQEASAIVLQQSLEDLGYQVEEVGNTLFVEGGVVHFRRQGWDDYMVRMRVDPITNTANFNVIRAVEEASNERSVRDHLAEDRWCAEFPALLQALEARGLSLNVTRRLEAGELPVQQVLRDKLPVFADEEEAIRRNELKSREIK